MRLAVIYRRNSVPPPDMLPQLMERLAGWTAEHQHRFSVLEFFVGGGGFGVLEVNDSADLERMIAAHPFTLFSDIEIRPVVEPSLGLQLLREAFPAS